MTNNEMQDMSDLEALFETARAAPPPVPEAVMARVLVDATYHQPVSYLSVFKRISVALGGIRGMGGLVTATCVGFWLGLVPPEGLPDVGGLVLGTQEVAILVDDTEFFGDFGWLNEEGDQDG